MATFDVTNSEAIPTTDRPYVNRLRRYLQDTEVLNVLDQVKESTDVDLFFALQDTVDEINVIPPITTYTLFSDIPWSILKLGATLQILVSQGILSARNQLTYNDAGGIQVSDMDKYGRYVNWFNVLINKYLRSVAAWKIGGNIDAAYGGVPSEYQDIGDA
jgi:hypothetical protein